MQPALGEGSVLHVDVLDLVVRQGAETPREVLEPGGLRGLPALQHEHPVVEKEDAHRLLERGPDEHRLEPFLGEDRAVRRLAHEIEEALSHGRRQAFILRR